MTLSSFPGESKVQKEAMPLLTLMRRRRGEAWIRCELCGDVLSSRQAAVHHAKRHVKAGAARLVPGKAQWLVESRYEIVAFANANDPADVAEPLHGPRPGLARGVDTSNIVDKRALENAPSSSVPSTGGEL